jgi:hypothetical protein
VTINFRTKNQALHRAALEVLRAEKPMTLRQLYYRLVSGGYLGNKQAEYNRLGNVMTRLRESGQVPRAWIVDHVRATLKPSSWSGLADFGDTVREAYRKDFWASMDHHVEVFVEKDAIAATIQPVTHEYDVALRVCRGYSSISFASEIADLWAEIEKPIFAYYLGDFDPSGFDIERDLREKFERYSGVTDLGLGLAHDERGPALDIGHEGNFLWRRLGVVKEDFAACNLISLPVKSGDRRAAAFIKEHGTSCAEVDAIAPNELRRRVRCYIESHIDQERWQKLRAVEKEEQKTLNLLVAGLSEEES